MEICSNSSAATSRHQGNQSINVAVTTFLLLLKLRSRCYQRHHPYHMWLLAPGHR